MTTKDFNYAFSSLDQRASATITIDNYLSLHLTKATGVVTIVDYSTIINAVAATGSITYGIPVINDTVIVNGVTLTCKAVGGAFEFSTIGELEALTEAVTGVNSSENGTVVSLVAAAKGTAGNAITLSLGGGNTGTMAISGATLTGGIAGETVTIDGTVLVAGVDWTASVDNGTTAESLKDAIHALANVNATRASGVITVEAATAGTAGNAITMAEAATGVTVGAATLAGGIAASTVVIDGNTVTESTNWNAVTSNTVTATNLAAALDAVAGYDASAVGAVVTVYYTTPGTGGNAKTLTSPQDAGGLTLSGATLSGGVAATYSDTFTYDDIEDLDELEVELNCTAITAGGTLDVAIETSGNKNDSTAWDEVSTFTQVTAASNETKEVTKTGGFARFKLVIGGASKLATGTIRAVAH